MIEKVLPAIMQVREVVPFGALVAAMVSLVALIAKLDAPLWLLVYCAVLLGVAVCMYLFVAFVWFFRNQRRRVKPKSTRHRN
jgi:membrane protein implicated in regulation of membrane protease activity